MLTRYVFFEGTPKVDAAEFRTAVMKVLLPLWQGMPGATGVRLTFAQERDEGAPEIIMVLAVDYPDRATLDASLASDHRFVTRDQSAELLGQIFEGKVHHHITGKAG